MILLSIMCGVAGFAIGVIAFLCFRKYRIDRKIQSAQYEATQIIQKAQQQADTSLKEADIIVKDKLLKMQERFEEETKEVRFEAKQLRERLLQKEEQVDKKIELQERKRSELEKIESNLQVKEKELTDAKMKYEELLQQQKQQLEHISGMTAEEAKASLLQIMEDEARHEAVKIARKIEADAVEDADKKAKKIIVTAIQRYAADCVSERTVSVVGLPNDEMKGRIIGREGRNIRALEAATGIDLIIDDTPEAVVLSGFNPVRREIARQTLDQLIADGRIHPARIEDVVKKVTQEVNQEMKEAGEQAAFDLSIQGLHPELIKYLGRLKFRTSYGQNVLRHSLEVGFLAGIMAAELGLNQKLARRMGLLHDLGKAVDHEIEGPHALIGAKLAKRHGESAKVVHAISAHHEDIPPNTVYAFLVQAADCLSGARPGARREILESYIKRIEDLENIANSYDGVSNSYAIQAGREVRVIVESTRVNENEISLLSKNIAKQIEESLVFPGQIRVTVIRETRAVEYANR